MNRSIWIFLTAALATALSLSAFASDRLVAEISFTQHSAIEVACDSYQTTERLRIYTNGIVRSSSSISGYRCDTEGEMYQHGYSSQPSVSSVPVAQLPSLLDGLLNHQRQASGRMAGSSHPSSQGLAELSIHVFSSLAAAESGEGLVSVRDLSGGAQRAWSRIREAVRSAELN